MANAWGTSFLRHLSAELAAAPPDQTQQLMLRIACNAQTLFNAHLCAPADAGTCTALGVSALMVSAYQIMGIELGRADNALATVERAFVLTYRSYIRNVCLPLLRCGALQVGELAVMNFTVWGRQMPPSPFVLRERHGEGPIPEAESLGCERFFEEHGAPDLTKIIQAADWAWIQALAGYRHEGHASCSGTQTSGFSPFHFVPAIPRPVPRRSATVLELDLGTSMAEWDAVNKPVASPALSRFI